MGKSFKPAAEAAQPVYSTIIGAAQEVQEVQEATPAQKALADLKTQGQKGAKLDRINMAFTADNMDYIRTMSKLKGQTMTQFVNILVAEEREKNGAAFEAAKAILESL